MALYRGLIRETRDMPLIRFQADEFPQQRGQLMVSMNFVIKSGDQGLSPRSMSLR
jgi:hypothetical protein